MNDLYVHIGRKVREKRRQLKWTQAKLAEAADISLSFLSHVERGTRKCSVDTLYRLCCALSIDANSLLGLQILHDPNGRAREIISRIEMMLKELSGL